MVGYILAFVAATLLLTVSGYTGYRTVVVAAGLGMAWLYLVCSGGQAAGERRWAQKLVAFSLLTVVILSAMLSTDFTAPALPTMLLSLSP